jgi:hypothetical protein
MTISSKYCQDGRQAKNRKGGMKLKKIFSETTEPISTKLC